MHKPGMAKPGGASGLVGGCVHLTDSVLARRGGARTAQVFQNVRDDELEHVKTMVKCQDYQWLGSKQVSPHSKLKEEKRQQWTEWAEEINKQATEEKSGGK